VKRSVSRCKVTTSPCREASRIRCRQTQTLRSSSAIPANNSRRTGSRVVVRMRARSSDDSWFRCRIAADRSVESRQSIRGETPSTHRPARGGRAFLCGPRRSGSRRRFARSRGVLHSAKYDDASRRSEISNAIRVVFASIASDMAIITHNVLPPIAIRRFASGAVIAVHQAIAVAIQISDRRTSAAVKSCTSAAEMLARPFMVRLLVRERLDSS
jgi:hypothetical protein